MLRSLRLVVALIRSAWNLGIRARLGMVRSNSCLRSSTYNVMCLRAFAS